MTISAKARLIPQVSIEQEWAYLVNETLIGERCILPLLETLSADSRVSSGLKAILRRQIGEETDHVEKYQKLLGASATSGSAYDIEFSRFISGIDSISLRLYSLQAILESISLGALLYRAEAFTDVPSKDDDDAILRDEQGHVRFGWGFLGSLKAMEDMIPLVEFNRVTRAANSIFARHFNGNKIASVFSESYGVKNLVADHIDESDGMRTFRSISTKTIVDIKNEFISRYYSAVVRK